MTCRLEKGPHLLPAPSSMFRPVHQHEVLPPPLPPIVPILLLSMLRCSSPSSSSACSRRCPLLQHALNNGPPPSTFDQLFVAAVDLLDGG
ncbi:unnamed protein product [Victoria cruziana]